MKFEEQITDFKVTICKPTITYLSWTNTEQGRDKHSCYERSVIGDTIVVYVNCYNKKLVIHEDNPFWHTLEKLYHEQTTKQQIND